jgi:IclR family pca regulon transcriptional regulator
MTPERDSETFVQSLARGISVIRAFGASSPIMTLSEVAQRAGVSRAGARRVLLTLQTLGYVHHDGRRFRLSPKILDLGYSYLSSLDLWDFAEPIMEELVETVHESCSASVLDGDDIVYVMRVPTHRIMSINLRVGSRLPAYAASMGRVLLGSLDDGELDRYLARVTLVPRSRFTVTDTARLGKIVRTDRAKGWSLVDQELEEGLRSIAVPLSSTGGRVIAALNISAHASRVTARQMVSDFLPRLQVAQARINESLRMGR